jgi:uncharacterized surface protein with fasciclin (FAS1) repeats
MGTLEMLLRRHILAAAGLALTAPTILRAQPSASIPDAMMADGRFASFIELLERSPALNLLRGAGRFTVFAPTNAGVDTIPATLRAEFTGVHSETSASAGDAGSLTALVNLHIVEGVHPLSSFTAPSTILRSRNGTGLKVERTPQNTLHVTLADNLGPGVGGMNRPRPATILTPVVMAENGIILPIDVALLK